MRDLGIVIFSIVIAVILVKTGAPKSLLTSTQELNFIGSFVAGIFFVSVFTAAPATVALAEIAQANSIFWAAFFGGTGALVGDRWLIPFIGALIVASPLPDELGLTMMGLSKMKTSLFIPLSFLLNFFGIMTVGLIAKAV